jgi:hypothetical protein
MLQPVDVRTVARKLLLVPILVLALFVTILEAAAAPTQMPRSPQGAAAVEEHRPAAAGTARRMR